MLVFPEIELKFHKVVIDEHKIIDEHKVVIDVTTEASNKMRCIQYLTYYRIEMYSNSEFLNGFPTTKIVGSL